jgi:hypothetical protein
MKQSKPNTMYCEAAPSYGVNSVHIENDSSYIRIKKPAKKNIKQSDIQISK